MRPMKVPEPRRRLQLYLQACFAQQVIAEAFQAEAAGRPSEFQRDVLERFRAVRAQDDELDTL